MPDFEKWNIKHHNATERDIKQISVLFDEMIVDIANLTSLVVMNRDVFRFKNFPTIENKINELLKSKAKDFEKVIDTKVAKHWNMADKKNADFTKKAFKKYGIDETPINVRNAEGLAGFQSRKGRKLSRRVWKFTGQFKQEIEMYIDLAIKEGTPASQLASKLQKHVRTPELTQSRYIQANGVKDFVKNIKVAKSGQGVYRSSYKNALRLARTEINASYRVADLERFNEMPFVIGYEIKRSKHPYPCNLCDMMAGSYPKTFYWDGNHPNCRCYLVPIMQSQEDFIESQLHYLNTGRYLDAKSITEINPKVTEWVAKNRNKIKANGLPYFLKNNEHILENSINVGDLMQKAKLSAPEIDALARSIARRFDGYVTPINLKSETSIMHKLTGELHGDISQIKDAVRNTIILPKEKISECVAYLENNANFVRVKIQTPDCFMGYSGVLSSVKTSHNILGEIQVNTEKMIYAKEKPSDAMRIIGEKRWREIRKETGLEGGLGHKYYEEWRVLDENNPKKKIRRQELVKLSEGYYKHFR